MGGVKKGWYFTQVLSRQIFRSSFEPGGPQNTYISLNFYICINIWSKKCQHFGIFYIEHYTSGTWPTVLSSNPLTWLPGWWTSVGSVSKVVLFRIPSNDLSWLCSMWLHEQILDLDSMVVVKQHKLIMFQVHFTKRCPFSLNNSLRGFFFIIPFHSWDKLS